MHHWFKNLDSISLVPSHTEGPQVVSKVSILSKCFEPRFKVKKNFLRCYFVSLPFNRTKRRLNDIWSLYSCKSCHLKSMFKTFIKHFFNITIYDNITVSYSYLLRIYQSYLSQSSYFENLKNKFYRNVPTSFSILFWNFLEHISCPLLGLCRKTNRGGTDKLSKGCLSIHS